MRILAALTSVLLALSLTTGCDWILKENQPESVEVSVDGPVDTATVVVSRDFAAQRDDTAPSGLRVSLLDADTLTVPLPYTRTYDIRLTKRFFVQVDVLEPETRDLRLQARIDGRLRYDQEAAESDSLLRFVYVFQEARPFDPGGNV